MMRFENVGAVREVLLSVFRNDFFITHKKYQEKNRIEHIKGIMYGVELT